VLRLISGLQPDLVINTGDISFDGADLEDDLAFARTCHAGLDVPFRAIPGNHDVGDNPWRQDLAQPITESRLSRYRHHFGDDHWLHEAGRWLLIGRYIPPDHRRRLMELLGASVRVVASGHVHQHRQRRYGDVHHGWAPSTAFVLPDRRQPRLGTKQVGYIDYMFAEDRVDIRIVEPPKLTNHDIDEFPDTDEH
jgi:3',5'-cyclic AMP phosphodiesterase CpdA